MILKIALTFALVVTTVSAIVQLCTGSAWPAQPTVDTALLLYITLCVTDDKRV